MSGPGSKRSDCPAEAGGMQGDLATISLVQFRLTSAAIALLPGAKLDAQTSAVRDIQLEILGTKWGLSRRR